MALQAGTGSPVSLGGSTGNIEGLEATYVLTFYIYYKGQTTPVTPEPEVTLNSSNFTSATDPMPTIQTPSPVNGSAFNVTWDGQLSTGSNAGDVHLLVTPPAGQSFSTAFLSAISAGSVVWTVSDDAGLYWDNLSAEELHNYVYSSLETPADNVVDLYFPPYRDESPVNGSPADTMMLQVAFGDGNVYATPFMGGSSNPELLAPPPNSQLTAYNVSTASQLQTDLNEGYGTISLQAGATITSQQPILITDSVTISGNNATLEFEPDGAVWPATATGALYVNQNENDNNLQITLNDFTIDFANTPLQWDNPAGDTPALYDPNNNVSGYQLAVFSDAPTTGGYTSNDYITITRMTIDGPPAIDVNSSPSFTTLEAEQPDYVGEPDLYLINANPGSSGSISNNTFAGGNISLWKGPWIIQNNTVQGAAAYTYSTAAFSLQDPHDDLVQGNTVTQAAADGTQFRLVNLAGQGFNNTVEDNWFGGNAGLGVAAFTYDSGSEKFLGRNWPEIMLEEANGVVFEGRPGAVSLDGRLIVLPNVRDYVNSATGPGDVVSILEVVNSNGTTSTTDVGQWYRVAQFVNLSSTNTIDLLMEDPLPQPPAGAYYIVVLTGGYVNDSFLDNTINLANKTSVALELGDDSYGDRVIGNEVSFGASYDGVFPGVAMLLNAGTNSAETDGGTPSAAVPYPLPDNWTALPLLGLTIEDNTFRDTLGIDIGLTSSISYYGGNDGTESTTGRVYFTATVVGNTFEWDSSLLSSWASAFTNDLSQDNPNYGNMSFESSDPPTLTIGARVSVDPCCEFGIPRYDWTVGGEDVLHQTPFFFDPSEDMVDVAGNIALTISSSGVATTRAEPTGQVMAGVVNGTAVSSTVAPMTYQGNVYYPFNVDDFSQYIGNQLNITTGMTGAQASEGGNDTQGIQALMIGQDNYDLVGAGRGRREPTASRTFTSS